MSQEEKIGFDTTVTAMSSENSSGVSGSLNMQAADQVDMTDLNHHDKVLSAKMFLVNNALDDIGFTWYHFKIFCLSGMGYAVDSQLTLLQSLTLTSVTNEFGVSFPVSAIMLYAGLLCGALAWGFSADIIGRKFAFNTSLLLSAAFALIVGGMPNFAGYCVLVFLTSMGSGGNLVLDTAVLLEYLPFRYHWLMVFYACWWGIGQTIAVLITWPFLSNYSCADASNCTKSENMGWRYTWITNGGLVLLMALARITIIKFEETPKFLVGQGRDDEIVRILGGIAEKYGRKFTLTLDQLEQCGELGDLAIERGGRTAGGILRVIRHHVSILFSSRKVTLSTLLIILSWTLLGIAYPLYYVFLPQYLASTGAQFGDDSVFITYRNLVISNFTSTFGPVIAAALLMIPKVGQRHVMTIGAVISMTFLFAYTAVRSQAQNVGFTCAVNIAVNIYYGVLYAYTPEVLPSAARNTGNSMAMACTRLMGCMAAIIGYYADASTSVPIYVCAAVFGAIGLVSVFLPFEPAGKRTV